MLLSHRYENLQQLGEGGFGKTFLVQDTQNQLHPKRVIKQLALNNDNPAMLEQFKTRFQQEATVLERLGSGNHQIPTLYDYFQSQGQFYFVMEWIEGINLGEKVKQEGAFNESMVKSILLNILPILEYIHQKKVIHRDIKPDNIIIRNSDNLPVLVDFGAVKEEIKTVLSSSIKSIQFTMHIGTPGFTSIEQMRGRPVYGSDLYSLGVTAIFLLTGLYPQELEQDLETGELKWRDRVGEISSDFVAVLEKATREDWRDRYRTAKEMRDALLAIDTPTVPLSKQESSSEKESQQQTVRINAPHLGHVTRDGNINGDISGNIINS
ncbi:MAG: serine/threonine protein kinase [Cyanobacteria bacterium SBLK]|nr:serine/threonine protein kinase [Cyanobacteria bacterium SBLK]